MPSGFFVDIDKLHIPQGMVWFGSNKECVRLVLNPEIGAFTVLSRNEFDLFQRLAQGNIDDRAALKQDQILQKTLSNLITRKVIYYGDYRPVLDESVPIVPKSVYWETTFGCTLRCVYCYMSAETPKPNEISTQKAEGMILEMAEIGVKKLVFTGGEPFLRKDIFHLAKLAKENGLITEVITNATLIKDVEIARKVKQLFDYVIVSLDGACSEHNDPHRGKGSFEPIVKGIKLLNRVGIEPCINSTISNMNVEHTRELLDFVKVTFNTRSHRLIHLGKLGRGKETEYELEDWDNYKLLHQASMDSMSESPPEVLTGNITSKRIPPSKNCGMGSGEIYIDSVGDVFPCKLVTTPEWHSGNVKDSPLFEILKSSPLQKARDISVTDLLGCRSCMIRRLCGGGCRGNHMGITGDVFKNNPQFCWTLRHRMVSQLWMLSGYQAVLHDEESYVPYTVLDNAIWEPEIGTALPESQLIPLPMAFQ